MWFKNSYSYFVQQPKKLILVDGIGAIISAFMLGYVLVKYQVHVGIPAETLSFLADIPLFFVLYDLYCYFSGPKLQAAHLQLIASANLGYVFLSIAMAIYHAALITPLGWTYLGLEILILLCIISLEFKVAKALK